MIWRAKHAGNGQIDRISMFMEKEMSPGVVCHCPGAIHIYMTIIFKHHLLRNSLANQSQTLCGGTFERGIESLKNGQGHMTKMAATAINSKTFKNLLLQNQKALA